MTRLEAAHSIKKLTEQLVSKYHPEKIILFGSAAQGLEEINDIETYYIPEL